MKNSKFLPIFLSLLLLLGCLALPAAAVERPSAEAKSALVLDRSSGEVLYSKNADRRSDPADLTMLMTGLLAVEAVEAGKVSLNDMVTVTEAMDVALDEGSGVIGLQAGEQLTLGSLLQCMLIASAADAANVVADYVGGSIKDFVTLMNARAADLGCTDTHFSNVHGAYAADHYSTATDLCRLAQECLRHERLTRICGTVVAELNETNLSQSRTLRNTNALICDESPYGADYVIEDVSGLKSGYNARAGYTLVAAAERDGVALLCAVLGGTKTEEGRFTAFTDAAALIGWVFDNYAYQEVLKSTENIASVDVALGMNATYVNLRPATSIIVLLPNDFTADDFEKDIRVYALENGEPVTAPVTAGQVLGEVTLTRSGVSYGTVKLVASASVELSRMQYIKQQVQETTRQQKFRLAVAVLAVLFLLYLVWVVIYRVKRLKYLYAVRAAERERAMMAETAVKHAPEPKTPGIRFFNERGQTSAPAPLPEQRQEAQTAPEPPAEREPPDEKIVALFQKGTKPKEPSAPAAETAPAPVPAPAPTSTSTSAPASASTPASAPDPAPDAQEGDLLAGAVLVARLEPLPPPREETAEERAERDYFAEFFRQKR